MKIPNPNPNPQPRFLISNIGALVASFDRQAGVVEQRLDAVKEYIAFYQIPPDLVSLLMTP